MQVTPIQQVQTLHFLHKKRQESRNRFVEMHKIEDTGKFEKIFKKSLKEIEHLGN